MMKKPDLAILIGRMRKGPPMSESGDDEGGEDLALESVKTLMQAIKDDDPEAATAALRAAITACGDSSEEE